MWSPRRTGECIRSDSADWPPVFAGDGGLPGARVGRDRAAGESGTQPTPERSKSRRRPSFRQSRAIDQIHEWPLRSGRTTTRSVRTHRPPRLAAPTARCHSRRALTRHTLPTAIDAMLGHLPVTRRGESDGGNVRRSRDRFGSNGHRSHGQERATSRRAGHPAVRLAGW